MTVEQLHDAIGLLPADLLAETDKARQAPPPRKTVLWKSILAMAACLTLVLTGWFWWFQPKGSVGGTADIASLQAAPGAGAAENGAAEEEKSAEEALPFRSQSAATDGTSLLETISTPRLTGEPENPAAVLLTCPADWTDYRTQMGEQFDLTELAGRMESLGDSWFEDQDLVLIRVENVPLEETPRAEILRQEEGILEIGLPQYSGTVEGTCWHILLPVEKGTLETAEEITLIRQ